MTKLGRRRFLANLGMSLGATPLLAETVSQPMMPPIKPSQEAKGSLAAKEPPISFSYSPLSWQTAFCFPDDPHKSLVGERGELRFSRNPSSWPGAEYPDLVEFSMLGMEEDRVVEQKLEAPGVPIVHTRLERPAAYLTLITFATNRPSEGHVDNVLMTVAPRAQGALRVAPQLIVKTGKKAVVRLEGKTTLVMLGNSTGAPFMVTNAGIVKQEDTGTCCLLQLQDGLTSQEQPLRYFVRFPQENQPLSQVNAGLTEPDQLLTEARDYWRSWKAFGEPLSWKLPEQYQAFLISCARNIQQAREVKNGKLTFQVGPTCYRGLWVVDGNFILEAARYLGYDHEAQQGLEATWARQEADGGIFAGGGREHWKDTGIAMFTLVRQAELSQEWGYFREMQPSILRAIHYLTGLRDKAKSENSANGRYGLLARGFGDGGMSGIRSEFTNTLWVLAGLKAVTETADQLGLSGFEQAQQFYQELREACLKSIRQEMRQHPKGFEYLPMLMKEDPAWNEPDPWDRPRPQNAQWALSHAIYPGLVFDKNDPVVKGHIALMQACTQEDVPIETGWLPHEGLWTYNAPFVSHVYLWTGLTDWARRTFIGFLNHACPTYCWREEQPLRGSLFARYVGDMPHNWASAECVLFLRHMLALEDGSALRLLEGIGNSELASDAPIHLVESPTRFGRITMRFEPLSGRKGWRLEYGRTGGPAPKSVQIPFRLGQHFAFSGVKGATSRATGDTVQVSPEAVSWVAAWGLESK